MPAWTPADLAVAPLSWHDVSNSASLSLTGSAVNFVADLQGAVSRRLEGAFNSGSALPTYSATGLAGGRPGITFPDNLRTLRSSTSVSANYGIGATVGVFMAFSHDGSGGYVNSLFGVASNTASGADLSSNGGVFHWPDSEIGYRGNRDANIDYRVYTPPNVPHNLSIVGSATDTTFYIDGGAPAPTTWGSAPTWVGHKIGIGADPHSLEGGMPGLTFGELVILGYTPSADDRQRIEGYMAWKWGSVASLPSDHPYKTAAPQTGGGGTTTSQTVSVTSTGVISIRKMVGKRVAVAASGLVSVLRVRALRRTISVASAGAVTVLRRLSFSRVVSIASSAAVAVRKAISKQVSVASASTVLVNAVKAAGAAIIYQTVAVIASSSVAVRRSIGKRVAVSATGAVSVRKSIAKAIAVAATGAVQVAKGLAVRITVAAASAVSVTAGRLYRQTVNILGSSSVIAMASRVMFSFGQRVIRLLPMMRRAATDSQNRAAAVDMENRTVAVLSDGNNVAAPED